MPLCEFLPRVFVGGVDEAEDVKLLRSRNICSVLTCGVMCTGWCIMGFPDKSRVHEHDPQIVETGERHRLRHLAIEIFDSLDTDLRPHLQLGLDFVDKALKRDPVGAVLIHCYAGQSRSVSFCIAYMMRCSREGAHQCLSRIRSIYPDAKPNISFMNQLDEPDKQQWLTRRQSAAHECSSRSPEDSPEASPSNAAVAASQPTKSGASPDSIEFPVLHDPMAIQPSTQQPVDEEDFFAILDAVDFERACTHLNSRRSIRAALGDTPLSSSSAPPGPANPIAISADFEVQAVGARHVESSTTPINEVSEVKQACNKYALLPLERGAASGAYCCRVCRHYLFYDTEILPHQEKPHQKLRAFSNGQAPIKKCSSLFVDLKDWMNLSYDEQKGCIQCPNPKCRHKLGGFCFYGTRCSCGVWQSPSFQIHDARVDLMPLPAATSSTTAAALDSRQQDDDSHRAMAKCDGTM